MSNIYRYRVTGYIEVPSNSGDTEFVSFAPAHNLCDEPSEALESIKTMMEDFPACTHFTVTRGAWK